QSSRPEAVEEAVLILLADIPMLAALINRRLLELEPIRVKEDLPYTSRFFHTALARSDSSPLPDPETVSVLDLLQILHIDHGQNCSSSAVRLVGSGGASIFSSIAAGISALSGPLHGGANRAVLGMLEEIRSEGGDIEKALHRAKDRSDPFRLMGFGHRVYRNFDPRAKIIKATAGKVLSRLGKDDPLLQLAKDLESAALADEYFAKRRLYPNVDFYSGFLYRALGFPTEMFTVLFAIGRLPGWLSHWREMASDPKGRIFRPRQVYVGRTERRFSRDL
ncbi:MAG: citrate (Si)-synthase, partial [bacterium]|nr:citrate (Si)-synthase [bacterium]